MRAPLLADDEWTAAWGISWCATRREDGIWIGQAGGIPGFTSAICFDPAAQIGAVVLFNGTIASAALGMDIAALARHLAGGDPAAVTPPAPTPDIYRPLLGIYAGASLGGWLIRLEWRDAMLTFTAPEAPAWQVTLTQTADPDHFTVAAGGDLSGENVTFRRLADGRVASVFLAETTWVRLDQAAA